MNGKYLYLIFCSALDVDKNGYISKDELLALVNTLYHLIPAADLKSLSTSEQVVDEIISEIADSEGGAATVVTREQLLRAVERAEHLTTIVLDKILMRSSCACWKIVNKTR